MLQAATLRAQKIILDPPGKTAKTQSYNASRAAGQLAAYRAQLRKLGVEVDAATGRAIRDAYRAGRQLGQAELRNAGLLQPDSPISGTFSGADTRQAEILTRSAQRDMRKAINSMGDTTERLVRQANALDLNKVKIARILAGGSVEGVPLPTLQRLRKEMRKIAKGGLVYVVNGRTGVVTTFKPDYYADLVYQTNMAQAEEAARHQQYREAGIDLVKIIGSNSRNFCTAFVNKVYSLSGTHPIYPAFSVLPRGGPPFHPRCTKRTIAFEESLATADELEKARPTPTTERMHGQPPAEAQKVYDEANRPVPEDLATTPPPGPASAPPAASTPPAPPPPATPDVATPPIPPGPRPPSEIIEPPKKSPSRQVIIDTMQIVDAIHDVPTIAQAKIAVQIISPKEFLGVARIKPPKPVSIGLKGQHFELPNTLIHEFGHALDHLVFSTGTRIMGSVDAPELEPWRQAAARSVRFRQYRFNLARPGIDPKARSYLEYLLRPWEMFARAYAQWITEKSGDRNLRGIIIDHQRATIPIAWEDQDFAEISAALDYAFAAKGMLK